MQSADLAVLLTKSTANGGVGGQVDGVDPIRNPGKYRCGWMSKNYKGAFVHEIGHLFGARDKFHYHILNFVRVTAKMLSYYYSIEYLGRILVLVFF